MNLRNNIWNVTNNYQTVALKIVAKYDIEINWLQFLESGNLLIAKRYYMMIHSNFAVFIIQLI